MSDYTKNYSGSGYNSTTNLDAEFTAIETSNNSKLDKSGGTLTGELDMNSQKITNLADGVLAKDAVNLSQLQDVVVGIVEGTTRYYDQMSDAVTDIANIDINDIIILKERSTGNGGGATWDCVDATTVTEDEYGIVTGDATKSFVLRIEEVMSLRAFGTVGDDVADDNGAIQAAFDTKARKLIGHPDDTYRSDSVLNMAENQILDLGGAELKFYESGSVRYLVTNNDCTVENGTVRSATTDVTVRGAEYQQPICIGFSNSLTDFVENVIVRNVTLSSTSPAGNALFVFGACNNILCENIDIEAGAKFGETIGGHWSVEPGGDETQGTGHPNNVTFRNIRIGSQTYGGDGAIFLSAVRRFTFENIEIEDFTGDAIVNIFGGDHGFTYADDNFSQDMGSVINISGLQGIGKKGVVIELQDTLEAQVTWASNITLENITVQSNDTTVADSRGIELGSVENVKIQNCSFDLFYNSVFFNSEAKRITFEDCRFTNTYKNGVDADNSTNTEKLTFKKCYFEESNTATGTGYDMLFGSYIDGITIDECVFDSSATTFAVSTVTAAPPRNVRVINSHIENCGGTPFVFGSTTSFGVCELFAGNSISDDLNVNIRGGQDLVPYSNTGIQNTKTPMREFVGPGAAPNYGTYHPGDRIYDETPSASGKIGYVCTAGGTEGTYSEGRTATTDGTATFILSSASNVLRKLDYVTINSTDVQILSIDGTTVVADATIGAGSGLAIAYNGGTYKAFGVIDA